MASPESGQQTCRIEPAGGGYRVVGDLGLASATAVLAAGETAFAGQAAVEVDLAGVTDADSAGLAVLIEWTRSARRDGRGIVFKGLPPRLAALARIGGVYELLPLAG